MPAYPLSFQVGDETLRGTLLARTDDVPPDVLFLHGAGQATRERARPIAEALFERGFASFSFDFSGHGESTGTLHASSLKRRVAEAVAALRHVGTAENLSVCGFSMGAHVALELLKTARIANLVLFYPAIYPPAAYDVPFDARFSEVIRRPNGWRTADVLEPLAHFQGDLLIVTGDSDEVIPAGVVPLIEEVAQKARRQRTIVIPGGTHALLPRIYADPKLMRSIVDEIVTCIQP